MDEDREVNFKIYRFNPDSGVLPRFDSYILECGESEQVLDILIRIKEDHDPGLSFRRSCRHGICGSCAVRVNGKPVLACKTPVSGLVADFGTELSVTPLIYDRVLKDLIIDRDDYWQKMQEVKPYTVTIDKFQPESDELLIKPELNDGIADADYCIQCSSCYYVCPVLKISPSFLGPAAFVKAARFTADVRDYSSDRLAIVNQNKTGVWDCVKCLKCTESCPKGIDPFRLITRLRQGGISAGAVKDPVHTRHVTGFRTAIRHVGTINELLLAFFTLRFGLIRMIPRGILMVLKRKLHLNPLSPKSRNIDEVRKYFKDKRK